MLSGWKPQMAIREWELIVLMRVDKQSHVSVGNVGRPVGDICEACYEAHHGCSTKNMSCPPTLGGKSALKLVRDAASSK